MSRKPGFSYLGSILETFGVLLDELKAKTKLGGASEARFYLFFNGVFFPTSQPTVKAPPLARMGAAPRCGGRGGRTFLTFLIKTKNVKKVGEQAPSDQNKSNCQQTNDIPHTHTHLQMLFNQSDTPPPPPVTHAQVFL